MGSLLTLAVIAGSLIAAMVLMIPIVGIVTYHRRKLEEMRMRHQVSIAEETRAAIAALRQEFAELRDTTTQYDVSFDTALHRLESRMGHLEQRMLQSERRDESVRLGMGQENVRAGL